MQLARRPDTTAGVLESGGTSPTYRVGPYLTAGVALASASVIAVNPVASSPPGLSDIQTRVVQLTAGWDDVLQTAEASLTDIWNHFSAAPFPVLQQEIANQIGYIQDIIKDPTSITAVFQDVQDNLTAVFGSPATDDTPADPGALFGPFLPAGGATGTLYQSLDLDISRRSALMGVVNAKGALPQG